MPQLRTLPLRSGVHIKELQHLRQQNLLLQELDLDLNTHEIDPQTFAALVSFDKLSHLRIEHTHRSSNGSVKQPLHITNSIIESIAQGLSRLKTLSI